MASNRHLGRIVALQTLYEYDFRVSGEPNLDAIIILERNLKEFKETIDDTGFVKELVLEVIKHASELDSIIGPIAPEWPVDQIARIDKIILRLALYELLFHSTDIPPKVAINEAVELAKSFGGDNSSRFVNGVLGTAYRQHQEAAKKPSVKKAVSRKKVSS